MGDDADDGGDKATAQPSPTENGALNFLPCGRRQTATRKIK
jgi:hypothetical protein